MSMNWQTELLGDTAADHGKAMDRMYRFQRHFYDLSRRYYLLGRDRLLDDLRPPPNGTVLEIGCGTGRNLAGVAKRYHGARIHGIDISQEMLKSAIAIMQRPGLAETARFACVDATSFDAGSSLGLSHFDRVYFSYTLSMVPQWQKALAHACTLLGRGGELHVVDFGQCENLSSGFRALLFRWLAAFHVTPRADLKAVLTRLADQHGLALKFTSRYGGYTWQAALTPKVASQQPGR